MSGGAAAPPLSLKAKLRLNSLGPHASEQEPKFSVSHCTPGRMSIHGECVRHRAARAPTRRRGGEGRGGSGVNFPKAGATTRLRSLFPNSGLEAGSRPHSGSPPPAPSRGARARPSGGGSRRAGSPGDLGRSPGAAASFVLGPLGSRVPGLPSPASAEESGQGRAAAGRVWPDGSPEGTKRPRRPTPQPAPGGPLPPRPSAPQETRRPF